MGLKRLAMVVARGPSGGTVSGLRRKGGLRCLLFATNRRVAPIYVFRRGRIRGDLVIMKFEKVVLQVPEEGVASGDIEPPLFHIE